jgi:hypothetical protein
MHQSELRPWPLPTSRERPGFVGLSQASEELVAVEVQWDGLSFAQVWGRVSIDLGQDESQSVELRLKLGLPQHGVVVFAFGFSQ